MSDNFKINIKGQDWSVKFYPNAKYCKSVGPDSGAITIPDKKTIIFNKSVINVGYIRHELLHAIYAESHTESAHLDSEQTEEVCASILQTQFNNIIALTETILNELLEG